MTEVVAQLRRAWRRRYRVAMATRGSEQGASAVEYVGILGVVAALVATLILALSQPQLVMPGVRGLICAVVGGDACGGGPGGGASGGGEPGGGGEAAGEPGPTDVDAAGGTSGASGDGASPAAPGAGPAGPLEQVGSAIVNIGRGAWDEVVGIVELVRDPSRLIDAAEYIWNNPLDAARQLVWDDESGRMWESGDYGGAVGRTIWNVGSWFIPGYNIGKAGGLAGDFGRIARLGGEIAGRLDEVADLARRAERAAVAGNLDEAAELAARAQQQADEIADQARRAGCLGAGAVRGPNRVLALGGPGMTGVAVAQWPGRGDSAVLAAPCDDNLAAVTESQRLADAAATAATRADLASRAAAYRQANGIEARRNIGVASYSIDGVSGDLVGVSGAQARPGAVGVPANPVFTPTNAGGFSRSLDSEYKILEDLASRLGPPSQTPRGTVNLYTERPPCASCASVIDQFRARYPNVTVNVSSQ